MTATLVQHYVLLALADHLEPLMKECFRESKTAQDYKCAKTKTACIINEALAPHFNELSGLLREGPYTLIMDGSNNTGISQTEILNTMFHTNLAICFLPCV